MPFRRDRLVKDGSALAASVCALTISRIVLAQTKPIAQNARIVQPQRRNV